MAGDERHGRGRQIEQLESGPPPLRPQRVRRKWGGGWHLPPAIRWLPVSDRRGAGQQVAPPADRFVRAGWSYCARECIGLHPLVSGVVHPLG